MLSAILDSSRPGHAPSRCLGALVEHIGDDAFQPSLLAFCHQATGAEDCSLLLHRGEDPPELAGALSVSGSRSRELGDWYLRGGYYRVEPSLRVARQSRSRLLLHALRQHELPVARWRERYQRVGWSERVSLLMSLGDDDGWVFMNAYRPHGCGVTMDSAVAAFGDHAPALAGAVRRHLVLTQARGAPPPSPPSPSLPLPLPLAAPAAAEAGPWSLLSARERQVVDAILGGASTKECARALGVAPTSIATYRQRAFEKLGIRRQVELFRLAGAAAG
jgi:DNA-binding CsgD family transcriptional regulator